VVTLGEGGGGWHRGEACALSVEGTGRSRKEFQPTSLGLCCRYLQRVAGPVQYPCPPQTIYPPPTCSEASTMSSLASNPAARSSSLASSISRWETSVDSVASCFDLQHLSHASATSSALHCLRGPPPPPPVKAFVPFHC
jgi:hypothetical protein